MYNQQVNWHLLTGYLETNHYAKPMAITKIIDNLTN